jgi:hypothetical protein
VINCEGDWVVWNTTERGANETLQPGIKGPSTEEFTLGYERQLNATMALGAQLVVKETQDMVGWHILDDGIYEPFQWTDPDTGQTFNLVDVLSDPTALKGNSTGPGALGGDRNYTQEYTGVFFTFKKRYADG